DVSDSDSKPISRPGFEILSLLSGKCYQKFAMMNFDVMIEFYLFLYSCLHHWLFHVKLCSYHAQFAWKITLSQTLHPLFVDIDSFLDIDVA
ncbi:unnamed protein product, partial [Brassica rapa subsp. narinosa]